MTRKSPQRNGKRCRLINKNQNETFRAFGPLHRWPKIEIARAPRFFADKPFLMEGINKLPLRQRPYRRMLAQGNLINKGSGKYQGTGNHRADSPVNIPHAFAK